LVCWPQQAMGTTANLHCPLGVVDDSDKYGTAFHCKGPQQ